MPYGLVTGLLSLDVATSIHVNYLTMPSSHPACSPSDSLAFSYNPYHACDTPRRLLKIYIASHALAIIVSLNLLMLLTWHFSTLHIVEKFDVPFVWEAEFVEQQLNGGNIALWSMVFVLVSLWNESGFRRACWTGEIGENGRDIELTKLIRY